MAAAAREAHGRLRAGFDAGLLRAPAARVAALRAMRAALCEAEDAALAALLADLHKHRNEALVAELSVLYAELNFFIDGLKPGGRLLEVGGGAAAEPKDIALGETLAIEFVPLGVVLQISPFNFPLMLAIRPMIGAIAAGNCVLIKPSELVPECERFIVDFVAAALDPRVCTVLTGDREMATALLELRWDHITYTGSGAVGRVVAQAAARHLTPTLLELGGKNPAVVAACANLDIATRYVAFARWVSCGQICLANDYVLIEEHVYTSFVAALVAKQEEWYGKDPSKSSSLARIVNTRAFRRITSMLDASGGTILAGGERDEARGYIAPTIVELTLKQATDGDSLMASEIFGPVIVVIRVPDLATATSFIRARERPLALYMFGTRKAAIREVIEGTESGAACVNYAAMHAVSEHGWLGGVGESGMGGYGFAKSLETYSHQRQVYSARGWRARAVEKFALVPAWSNADGSQNKRVEVGVRLYLGLPFAGSGGVPPLERVRRLSLVCLRIFVPVAMAYLFTFRDGSWV